MSDYNIYHNTRSQSSIRPGNGCLSRSPSEYYLAHPKYPPSCATRNSGSSGERDTARSMGRFWPGDIQRSRSAHTLTKASIHFPSRVRSHYNNAPAYSERVPAERYSYTYSRPSSIGILSGYASTEHRYHPLSTIGRSLRAAGAETSDYLSNSITMYSANIALQPSYGSLYSNPYVPVVRKPPYYDVKNALQEYQAFKTFGAAGRSHYKPAYWHSKRTSECERSRDLSQRGYNYYLKFNRDY